MHHPTDRIAHTMAFVIPLVEQEIAQWVHHEGLIHERTVHKNNRLLMITKKRYVSVIQSFCNILKTNTI